MGTSRTYRLVALTLALLVSASVLVPSATLGQAPPTGSLPGSTGGGLELPKADDFAGTLPELFRRDNIGSTISDLWSLTVIAAGVIFMILFLIGGFMYLASAGGVAAKDAKSGTENAKRLLLDAVIGLVLVLVAYPVGVFILNKLGAAKSDKVEIESESEGSTPFDGTTTDPLNGIGFVDVNTSVIGAPDGIQVQIRTVIPTAVDARPLFPFVETAQAASAFSQTATVTNEQASFTKVPTDQMLEYVHEGTILGQTTVRCPDTVSLAPTGLNPDTIGRTIASAFIPSAQAATNFLGEDDNFSTPSTNVNFENSSQTQGSSTGGASQSSSSSGGFTNSDSGTSTGDTQSTQTQSNNGGFTAAEECFQVYRDEVNFTRNIAAQVLVRIAVLDQSASGGLRGIRVLANPQDFRDYAGVVYGITNKEGHADIYVDPGKTYSISFDDDTYVTSLDLESSLQDRVHTAPSGPLGKATNPAAVWTIFARNSDKQESATLGFKVLDSTGKPLAGKKLYASQVQGQLDGSFDWSGNFNGGNPVYPDASGGFSLSVPIGRRVAVRYYSIPKQTWLTAPTPDCAGEMSEVLAKRTMPIVCVVPETLANIYPVTK